MSVNQLRSATLKAMVLMTMASAANADDLSADLSHIWRMALAQDATYAAARHALAMAHQKVPQVRAGLLPSVTLSAGRNRQDGVSSFDEGAGAAREVRGNSWNLQLAQPLLRLERSAALSQAQAQLVQAEEQHRLARQDLILRVAQSYFDQLVAKENATVALSHLDAVAQQLRLAQRNFEVGSSTVTDVHEAQARFQLARAQRVAATIEQESRQADLQKMLGALPGPLSGLRADAQIPAPQPEEPDAWTAMAEQDHPQVRLHQAALDAAGFELDRQRAGHTPTLDLTVSRGRNFNSGSLSTPTNLAVRTSSTQIGLQLNLPLYAGGGTQARVREAFAAQDKAQAELLAARRLAAAQSRQAFAGVVQGRAQVEALAFAVTASASAVDANKIGYRIGTRINIDVLNAEQQLHASQRDLFKARVDALMQGLRLKAAAGSLMESDIDGLNVLLDHSGKPGDP